jgi:glutaredoxin 2
MKLELYHYVHCPYCVRVRLSLGFLGLSYRSIVVRYDDEQTPSSLIGKKMLPIMTFDGKAIPESLDIIRMLDVNDTLSSSAGPSAELESLLSELGNFIHNLTMPYWIWTPEFDEKSREYFVKKKSLKRGPFSTLVRKRAEFEEPLMKVLAQTAHKLMPFWNQRESMSISDIVLASHLWGLYVVPEFRFPQAWHDYLQRIRASCHFDYHGDLWRDL